ncbi:MAG: class I fructose-bisphosphate aldolase [Hyphomonas sp.]
MSIVSEILSKYESDNPGVKANLYRILNTGRLAGTGKMLILPVDQGFEHGPVRSYAVNEPAYDPHYHFQLAIDAGLNAFASPIGMIEAGADTFAGRVPTILKMNSANMMIPKDSNKDQAITASVKDAVRLGCAGIGLTIYPGAPAALDMIEEARELIAEAKSHGLPSFVWSYPRDGDLTKECETAIDVAAYATHMAALIGAHVIKVKLASDHVCQADVKKLYDETGKDLSTLAKRVEHVKQAAFGGRRLVIFSGGDKKTSTSVYDDAIAIKEGGGNGSIIGRNAFKREKGEALDMLGKIIDIYKS